MILPPSENYLLMEKKRNGGGWGVGGRRLLGPMPVRMGGSVQLCSHLHSP